MLFLILFFILTFMQGFKTRFFSLKQNYDNCGALYDRSMFVEKKVRYSDLFTKLVGRHVSDVSFPISDVILAQLACPLSDGMFCLHSGITNLSLYKHCDQWHLKYGVALSHV